MTAAPRVFNAHPAARSRINLMLGLVGPSGSGKTWSALRLAAGIRDAHGGGDIVLIDTENGRARHYADTFAFRHIDFAAPFGSEDYLAAIRAAVAAKPLVIILDSLSHEHEGEGGFLDSYALELARLAGDDPNPPHRIQLAAWRRPKSARRALINGLLRLDTHLICCFRAAERVRMGKDEHAANPIEMGFTPIAGPEFIYELTASFLLRPGARGVPTFASERPGEAQAIKLPQQLHAMFSEGDALNEQHGRAMAQWAMGPSEPKHIERGAVERRPAVKAVRRRPAPAGRMLNGAAP